MAMTTRFDGKSKPDINMTPMIDILLVLLIIFMAISPVTPLGLDATAPEPPRPNQKARPDQVDSTVVIVIEKDGSLKLNQSPADWQNLEERLIGIFRTRAEKICFVKGHPDLEFQTIARAIDTARGAGVERVGLMTPNVEIGR